MIRSMTGFGRGENHTEALTYTVEIKTVNNRFADFTVKLPRDLMPLEDRIRNTFQKYVSRGKADVFVTVTGSLSAGRTLNADYDLVKLYVDALDETSERIGRPLPVDARTVLTIPDAFTLSKKDTDIEEVWKVLEPAVDAAGENLVKMRSVEGEKLKKVLLEILTNCEGYFTVIKERAPIVPAEYRDKLSARIKELTELDVDPARLAQEVAIFTDKCNIDEEIARLESHFRQYEAILESDGAVGKKLDFLVQEMNREVNTMGSKANDITITNSVLSLKCEIEKIREQIQNIE